MRMYSADAVTPENLDTLKREVEASQELGLDTLRVEIDRKQSQQIHQLRVWLGVSFTINVVLTLALNLL